MKHAHHFENLLQLTGRSARELRSLQLKLTYVGAQLKPIPTVAWTTYLHILQMEWFREFETAGLSYENDKVVVWNFVAAPDEIHRTVHMLTKLREIRKPHDVRSAHLSLMLVLKESGSVDQAFEAILESGAAESVTLALRDALDPDNGIARRVLEMQRSLIFPQGT